MISVLINVTAFVQSVHPLPAHKYRRPRHSSTALSMMVWSMPCQTCTKRCLSLPIRHVSFMRHFLKKYEDHIIMKYAAKICGNRPQLHVRINLTWYATFSAEGCNCKFRYCHKMSSVCLSVTECIVTKYPKLGSCSFSLKCSPMP